MSGRNASEGGLDGLHLGCQCREGVLEFIRAGEVIQLDIEREAVEGGWKITFPEDERWDRDFPRSGTYVFKKEGWLPERFTHQYSHGPMEGELVKFTLVSAEVIPARERPDERQTRAYTLEEHPRDFTAYPGEDRRFPGMTFTMAEAIDHLREEHEEADRMLESGCIRLAAADSNVNKGYEIGGVVERHSQGADIMIQDGTEARHYTIQRSKSLLGEQWGSGLYREWTDTKFRCQDREPTPAPIMNVFDAKRIVENLGIPGFEGSNIKGHTLGELTWEKGGAVWRTTYAFQIEFELDCDGSFCVRMYPPHLELSATTGDLRGVTYDPEGSFP